MKSWSARARARCRSPRWRWKRSASYCVADADCSWQLVEKLLPQLREKKLLDLYRDIEMPLVQVLLDMEWHGIGVDRAFLQEADVRLRGQIAATEKEVQRAGRL